jgi:Domain of unknown function (DUF222)
MTSTETSTDTVTLERFRSAVSVLTELPTEAQAYRVLGESDLLELNQLFATSQRILRGSGALIAGEIAHRSTPELGSQGLAQRAGHRTPEQFVKITTGATARDAVTAVKVGTLMREAALSGEIDPVSGEIVTSAQPWLAPVTAALTSRAISIEAADAIRVGLGNPNSAITAFQLEDAAVQLCEAALSLDPDALAREARAFRDELDIDGVAIREDERRQKRSLRLFVLPDGMTKLVWTMDPETAASVRDLYDRATSPKLGGVRFVSADGQKLADQILTDERTPEQLASDGFAQLLKLGADADPQFLLGSGAPVIRITATKSAVETRQGLARIEGQQAPVSIATLEKLSCEGGAKSVVFDESGTVLDFGREQRFFTRKQREALALMWGGCAAPGCDRPPSWCEAHHIVFWSRDEGGTDLADGILLCRHHHLLFHNNGWEIQRDASRKYWLIPPTRQDPDQTPTVQDPIVLTPKSRAFTDLLRERATA